jgi:membrane associated rhomboid family serine protease
MIVVPTSTDAPIYHWPYATVALILVNIALLFAIPPEASQSPSLDENGDAIESAREVSNFERYALAVGDGQMHPIQWVAHNFLHFDFLHLAGNMLFLWSFGIVVEGKLGAVRFLMTYLAIGTLHGALVQALLRNSGLDSHAAGASAVIYGLLAICMIWAPRNELSCTAILIVGFRVLVYHWELYYTTVAILYISEQLFGLLFWRSIEGRIMVSELGHLSGAFWGTVVGITLLKARLVDCEGWDLFTIWTRWRELGRQWNRRGEWLDRQEESLRQSVRKHARPRVGSAAEESNSTGARLSQQERGAMAVRSIRSRIEAGDIEAALDDYDQAARSLLNWPSQPDLMGMIKDLHARGEEPRSVRLMRDYCRFYSEDSSRVRLKLAQTLIRDHRRPVAALRVLQAIPADSLPIELEKVRRKLAIKANRMLAEGVLELEGDD